MRKTNNILVLTFWSYKEGLIHSYVLPYLRLINKHLQGHQKIYLVTLEKEGYECSEYEKIETHKYLNGLNIVWIYKPYYRFGLCAIISWTLLIPKLALFSVRNKISHIHSWCTPAGAIGYFVSLITGKKLVIDSYEPHAESMVENGEWSKDSLAYKLLFYLEKKQSQSADHLISATEGMRVYTKEKFGVVPTSFYVKPACVDINLFSRANKKKKSLLDKFGFQDKLVAVYAGKFGGIYLEREFFELLKVGYNYWGDKLRVLILSNHTKDEIDKYCESVKLPREIVSVEFVNHAEIADYMGLADFALTPVKPIPTKKYCTPIKDGEYWALGLPIIITNNISDDTDIIRDNDIGAVIESFDEESYLVAIKKIDSLLSLANQEKLYQKIHNIAIRYRSFHIAESVYKEIYC